MNPRWTWTVATLLCAQNLWAQDAGTVARDASATPPAAGACVADAIPADRAPTVTVTLDPEQPKVGDLVRVTYRFRYRSRDRVEFDPDVVAFQQPSIELDYGREQPERDRTAHPADNGFVTTDVVVAVQPFRVADVVIRAQPARVNTGDEIARLCTPEVRFRVRGVFGNTAHPQPRDITHPEDVRRDALTARWIALGLDGLFVVVVTTLGVNAWLRARPRKMPPPPPPRHPYEVAREGLDVIARGDLIPRGLTKDYYDAISDVIRRYLGGMRNFDAIEMTSHELLARVRKQPLPGVPMIEIERLLGECDLVKFARYVPSHEEADEILQSAFSIIERGRPMATPQAPAPPPTSTEGAS